MSATVNGALPLLQIPFGEEPPRYHPVRQQLDATLLAQLEHPVGPQRSPVQQRELHLRKGVG